MAATWTALPHPVQAAVERHVGLVRNATAIAAGENGDVSCLLHTRTGPVFLKGVEGVSRRMRWLRNEITAGKVAAGIAPTVLFHEDVAGWLVVAFEFVPGRAAGLAPGSPDLALVAPVLEKISTLPAKGLRPLRDRWNRTDWWHTLAEQAPNVVAGWDVDEMTLWTALLPDRVDGDRLVHTDLHGAQFLIAEGTIHVIDWGFPGAGAPWIDTAFLALRLVEAGHRPDEAEAWARSLTSWSAVDRETLTAFAVYLAGMWTVWSVTNPSAPAARRAELARGYASWRLESLRSPARSR